MMGKCEVDLPVSSGRSGWFRSWGSFIKQKGMVGIPFKP